MNIELLKYVLEVERVGSISQAADNLYMGQPNLSKTIKELENTLNIRLFKRTPKGVQTTDKGKEFLRRARIILEQYEQMAALGQDQSNGLSRLHIAVPHTGYVSDALTVLVKSLSKESEVHIEWVETDSSSAIRQVFDGISDVGIIRCADDVWTNTAWQLQDHDLRWQKILTFQEGVLISCEHPLAACDKVSPGDLSAYIEICSYPEISVRSDPAVMEPSRENKRRKLQIEGNGNLFHLLSQIPGSYLLDAPLPEHILNKYGLVQKLFTSGKICHDLFIYRTAHTFRPAESAFLTALKQTAASLATRICLAD